MCQRKKLRKTLPVAKLGGMSDEAASPKISVVVPVYKVEKYLRECVESVLAQSFEDFELILVDDGSPDRSGEICDELAKRDSRIRVFHQENGGVTSARRLGVEQARGEWICFVDSDDLLPPNALKDLIDEASDDVDWVQGMHCSFNDGEKPDVGARTGKVKTFDLVGLVENMMSYHPTLWGKLVRKRLFSPHIVDIPREVRLGEDRLMNLRLISNKPRSPKEIDKVVYFYRKEVANSTTSSCLRTENYILRLYKLLSSEMKKFPTTGKKRLTSALSQYLFCVGIVALLIYGLPIKFPHRLATLIRPAIKGPPRRFFVYLCLRLSCPGVASAATRIYYLLHGMKFDAKEKTLLG